RYDAIVGGGGEQVMSVVFPVRNTAAQSIWLGLHNAFSETAYEIEDLRLRWLQSEQPVPIMAGGITYIEEGDDEQHRRNLIVAVGPASHCRAVRRPDRLCRAADRGDGVGLVRPLRPGRGFHLRTGHEGSARDGRGERSHDYPTGDPHAAARRSLSRRVQYSAA